MRRPTLKPGFLLASMVVLLLVPLSAAQPSCPPAVVEARVEVPPGEFSLADLLAPSACPALERAAARVRLGSAPLAGSVRVLEADEVRGLFEKIAAHDNWDLASVAGVPERITVRRAGVRATCGEIGEKIGRALPERLTRGQTLSPDEFDCAAAGRIPENSPLQIGRITWNPALASWEISARCARRADCVPFLVRLRGRDPQVDHALSEGGPTKPGRSRAATGAARAMGTITATGEATSLVVRRGETMTLFWDGAGIHLMVPVVSLDVGGMGEKVRARFLRGGRIVSAVVVGAGQLRAAW